MTDHALDVLEFERSLERVARRATSDVGRDRIRSLRPVTDPETVRAELTRVSAAQRFVAERPSWVPGPLPDVRDELRRLSAEGAVLEPIELHRISLILRSSETSLAALGHGSGSYPELDDVVARLVDRSELAAAIERSVDDEGNVLSTASGELRRIRDRLRGAQQRIVRKLESYLASLPERFVVPDASVTVREGRYVIPIRREGRGEVGGIIHDESQTGATLFVEPPLAIEATNDLRDLEREEGREIRRILGELSARLVPLRREVGACFDALVELDTLLARGRTGVSWQATAPQIVDDRRTLELRDARHPLLVEAGDAPVVPYDLELGEGERCLVVSGPNTGGKSVFLKATGLIAALAQSGVVPPVGPGTRLPVYRSFFADIGDEQSIARNLSTFSAHLENLAGLVAEADEGSLVLIDEMGTGTDPAEGAALSRAILETLVERGATTLVSSHLGALKQLDTAGSGIVNASLQFDAERMEPTYRLVKGRPGRSYGLVIARRLGFPDALLDRAEEHLGGGVASFDDVVERLEEREADVERLLRELDTERARARRLRHEVERRAQTLEEAERTAEDRARSDARRMLLEAREEVEHAIRRLRRSVEEGRSIGEAATEARRAVEDAAQRHREERLLLEGSTDGAGDTSTIEEGDSVRIRATGARGRVVELRSERGLVEVGALRFEVAVSELEPADAPTPDPQRPRAGSWSGAVGEGAKLEIDLRGLRVDEMELELARALDRAVFEGLSALRIIHGKGTGALRTRVAEMLGLDARVRDFRMGVPGEGGAGVTVAELGGGS